MTSSTLVTDYSGRGLHSARPVTPNIPAGATAIYYETDTTNTFVWTGAAWVQINSAVSSVGYDFFATHPLQYGADGISVALALAANGGSLMTPIVVKAPMWLQSLSYRNTDTTLARSMEWRLYLDTNASVNVPEVAGANGTDSFTAAAASTRESAVGSPPIVLTAGVYWVVLRNTHASNTLGIGTGAASNGLVPAYGKTKTLGSPLGTPLDLNTSWTTGSIGNAIAAVRLNGRIFGQSTSWS